MIMCGKYGLSLKFSVSSKQLLYNWQNFITENATTIKINCKQNPEAKINPLCCIDLNVYNEYLV